MKILETEQLVLARYVDGALTPLPEMEAKWLKVYSSKYKHGEKVGTWMFVARSEPCLPEDKKPDAIVIAAILEGDHPIDNRLVLTKEYRIPIMGHEIGFPAGLIDTGETPEEAAIREFKEETGLDLEVTSVSPLNLYSSAGLTNESSQIVFGKATGEVSTAGNEGSEDIEVILASSEQVYDFCEASDIIVGAKAWPIMQMLKWSDQYSGHMLFPQN